MITTDITVLPDPKFWHALADADLRRREVVRAIYRVADAVERGSTLGLYQSASVLEQLAISVRDLGRTSELKQ